MKHNPLKDAVACVILAPFVMMAMIAFGFSIVLDWSLGTSD